MGRNSSRKAVAAGWVAVLLGFFAFGEQTARSLPDCVSCPCREVKYFAVPAGFFGHFVPGTKTPLANAILNIDSFNNCGDTPKVATSTPFEEFNTTNTYPICRPIFPSNPQQLEDDDPGQSGTSTGSGNVNNCTRS